MKKILESNNEQMELFSRVVNAIKTGYVWLDEATCNVVTDYRAFTLHFTYTPKACDISLSINDSKPSFAQRVKKGIARCVTPHHTSVKVVEKSGYNNEQTGQFTGLRQLRLLMLCRAHRVADCK